MSIPRAGSRRLRLTTLAAGASAALLVPCLTLGVANAQPAADATTTTLTGAGAFTQTVPGGVCSVNVTIAAGHGGGAALKDDPDWQADSQPGAGATLTAHLDVQSGEVLTGTVGSNGGDGGAGGAPGGGAGGAGTHPGGGGAGYSELTIGADRLLLAGGGGGTGGGHTTEFGFGGDAGAGQSPGEPVAGGTVYIGTAGTPGQDNDNTGGGSVLHHPGAGLAGTETAGGAAGTSSLSSPDFDGSAGSSLAGGAGGTNGGADHGGGGGAGYFGGGGGADTNDDVSFVDGTGTTHFIIGGGGGGGSTFVSDDSRLSNLTVDRNVTTDGLGSGYAEFDWVMCEYDLGVTKSIVGSGVFEDGDEVTYRVTVTNNGDDPMAVGDTVTIEDDHMQGGTLTDVRGDLSEAAVAIGDPIPGDQLDVFDTVDLGGGVTGQRGLRAGDSVTIEYSVVVNGTDPVQNTVNIFERGGDPDNNTASAVVDPARPSIDLVKKANAKKVTKVGQKITYSFIVTNTGNIVLHDFVIDEGSFSGKGDLPTPTCPDVAVEPGDSITCTTTYTAVKGDLTGDDLENTATASASTPNGASVLSDVASASLDTQLPSKPGPSGLLPDTGSPMGLALLGVAAAAVTGGAVTVAAARRRGQNTH